MQTINHPQGFTYFNSLLRDMETLYALTSDEVKQGLFYHAFSIPRVLDSCLEPIYNLFREYAPNVVFGEALFSDRDYEKHKEKYNPKNIIVCYSGGKDSLAVVMHYKKMGYNVYAYHIKGLNRGYQNEWRIAQKASESLGFNLIIDTLSYSGNHIWVEHPMKNMIMANMALNYGVQHNITTKVAVGDFRSSTIENCNEDTFRVDAGDTVEMWKLYENAIKTIIPGFKVYMPNISYSTAYNAILKNPELLEYTVSCMTTNRFQEQFRQRSMRLYDTKLLENRCGVCTKCALEYIIFCDNNIFDFSRKYYIKCLEVLIDSASNDGREFYYVYDLWDEFFKHNFKKSRMYKELKDATIQNRKIRFTN